MASLDGYAVDTAELLHHAGFLKHTLEKLEQVETRIGTELSKLAESDCDRRLLDSLEASRADLAEIKQDLKQLIRTAEKVAKCYDGAEEKNKRLVEALPIFTSIGRPASNKTAIISAAQISRSLRMNPAMIHESWLLEMAILDTNSKAEEGNE